MKQIVFALSLVSATMLGLAQTASYKTKFEDAIPVLNVGTFHMGYTPDANKTAFDEHDQENVRQVHAIASMLAAFRPTVIVVETTAGYQEKLERLYRQYLENPTMSFENPNEVELLAYEVGRLSETKRIYGIDHQSGYNYTLYYQLSNRVDTTTYPKYGSMMATNEQAYLQNLGKQPDVLDMLIAINQPLYLDHLININADMLTYVSSPGNHEGADEAAKFYHRNLIMYSNLNQIPLTKEDRVLILMGATHTAFFQEWIDRSPKYRPIPVSDYLQAAPSL